MSKHRPDVHLHIIMAIWLLWYKDVNKSYLHFGSGISGLGVHTSRASGLLSPRRPTGTSNATILKYMKN